MMDSLPSVNVPEKSPIFSSTSPTSLLKNNPATQEAPPQDPYTFPSSPLPGKFNKHDKRNKTRLWRYMFTQEPQREPPQELFNQDGHISGESEKLDTADQYCSDKERIAKIMNKDFNHNQKVDGTDPSTEQQKKDHFEFSEDETPLSDVLSKKKQRGSKMADRPQLEDGQSQPTCSSENVKDNIFDYINNVNPPPLLSLENPTADLINFGKKRPGKQAKPREKVSKNMVEQENGETSIKICDVYTDDMFNFLDEIPTVPIEGKHSDSTETYTSDLVDTPSKNSSKTSKEDLGPNATKRKMPDDSETDSAAGDSPSKKRRGRPPKGKPGRKPRQKRGEGKGEATAMSKSPRAKGWNYLQKDQSSSSCPSLHSDVSQPPSPSSLPNGEHTSLENHCEADTHGDGTGADVVQGAASSYPSQIDRVQIPAKRGPGRPPKMPSLTPVKIQQATSTQPNGMSPLPMADSEPIGNGMGEPTEMPWETDMNLAAMETEVLAPNKPGRKKGPTPRKSLKKTPRKSPGKRRGKASPAGKKAASSTPQSERYSADRELSPPMSPESTKKSSEEPVLNQDQNPQVSMAEQSPIIKQSTADSSLAQEPSVPECSTPVNEMPVTSSTTKKRRKKRVSKAKEEANHREISNPESMDNISMGESTPAKGPGAARKGKKAAKNVDSLKDEDTVSLGKISAPQSPLLSPEVPLQIPDLVDNHDLPPENPPDIPTTSKDGNSKLEEKLPIKKRKKRRNRSSLTMPRRISKVRAPVNKQVSAADSTSVLPKGRKKRTKKIPPEGTKVTRNTQKRALEAVDMEGLEEKAALLRSIEPSPIKMALRPQSSPVKFDFNDFEDSEEDLEDDMTNEDADPSYTGRVADEVVDVCQSTAAAESRKSQSPQKRRGGNRSRTSRRSLSFSQSSQTPTVDNTEEQAAIQEAPPRPLTPVSLSGSATQATTSAAVPPLPVAETFPKPVPMVQQVQESQVPDSIAYHYKMEIAQLRNLLRESDMVIGYLIRSLAECGKTIPADIKDQLGMMLTPAPVQAPYPPHPAGVNPSRGSCLHHQQRRV